MNISTSIAIQRNVFVQHFFSLKDSISRLLYEINIKILLTSIVGGVLEFYVFVLFGFFAPTFGKLFFPANTPLVSTLFGFGVFAVGFLMRPLGGIVFGYIGDRFGRRTALYSSLILMGSTTLLIGLMPSYSHIGIAAPILIIFARLLQGMSAGGELPGGLVFAIEHANPKYSGFVGASIEAGYGAGTALGALAGFICSLPGIPEWSWRMFFIFGFILSLMGLYVRSYTTETPEFNTIKKTEKAPLIKGLKENTQKFIYIMMISSFTGIVYYLHDIVLPFFLKQQPFITESFARFCGTVSCWCFVILMPLSGLYSDKTHRLKPMKIGAVLLVICTSFMFSCSHLLSNKYYILLGYISIGSSLAIFFAPLEPFIAESFDKKVRCSCFSFCQNIGFGIFGGLTPMIATLLVHKPNGKLILAACVACWGILALIAMLQLQRKKLVYTSYT